MTERDIFIAAFHRHDAAGRAAYLDGACGDDRALRERVEALLREQESLGSFLERPAEGLGGTGTFTAMRGDAAADALEGVGAEIGPYKLLQAIGEGGMGAVFMAEQTEPVQRKVALKVIKPGMDSAQVTARFEAERQALALMDHPNIAKVFDGGATESGRPYFVMELVKGVPITAYCDGRKLTPRQRLELFVPVCDAVQHAHQKGVIHRDLKPTNVLAALYDGKPVPKVIDFGVAKAAGQPLTDKTLFTGFGAVVGTLEYMSPEQAELNQLDIDTRSDVYSLGVLLYELLTGTTPLERKRLKDTGLLEALRLIREEEPQRPSARLSTTEELPAVAASRGLEPKRLSSAIRGELDWIVMRALEKDRDRRYESANGLARDIERFLKDEPVQACPPSAWYRLRKFARRNKGRLAVAALVLFFLASLGGVVAWAAKDRLDRRQEEALRQAAGRATLETDVGRDLDEARAFCRGDRLREASAAVDHAEALAARGGLGSELARRVAQTRADVDMVARLETIRLERASVKDGHFDNRGADGRYRDAFRDYGLDVAALDAETAAERIQASAFKDQLLAALDDWLVCYSVDLPDRLLAVPERLLAVLRRADGDPWRGRFRDAFRRDDKQALEGMARDPEAAAQPPATVNLLGAALVGVENRSLAVDVLRSAQQRHPDDFWLNQELGFQLMNSKPMRAGEAMGYYRAALALRPDSPGAHLNVAYILHELGDLDGDAAELRKAIELKQDYVEAHYGLGVVLHEQGDLVGAAAEWRQAIALKPDYAEAHNNLGFALERRGDLAGAAAEYRTAVALKPDDAEAHYNLGVTLEGQGDLAGAVAKYRTAIALKPDLVLAHYNLGVDLERQGDLAGAVAELRIAVALKPDYPEARLGLGFALYEQGDLAGAVAECRKAIDLRPDYAEAHNNLGLALHGQGDLAGAVAEWRQAITLKPDFAAVHNNLGLALREQGDPAAAAAEFKKAIALKPDYAEAHYNLGLVLREQKGLEDDTITEFRTAVALKPDHAEAHCYLGHALVAHGEFREGLAEVRRGDELGSKRPGWPFPSAEWVRQCERLVALDEKLPDFLEHKTTPASAGERMELAVLCSLKHLNRAAVRFYEDAFAAEPKLADDLGPARRYNAACAAALTAAGQGKDVDQIDDKEKARLRRLALSWLRADLEALGACLDKGPDPAAMAAMVGKGMVLWQADPDLAGVRGPEALAKLPEAERQGWHKLWDDVGDMLARTQTKAAPEKKSHAK